MKITLSKKYLTFPVRATASVKKVCFYENGKLIFELDCPLDDLAPDFTAYADVSPFAGRTVELRTEPEMEITAGLADEMDLPGLYREFFRPQVHFTVPNGWNNDPNGLIYYNGEYHLFYQYNPCVPLWGNMHWGHAVSNDLLHWKHLDTALFPDERGMMYSGCAWEDTENRTGLGKGGKPPLLLYYTAAAKTRLSEGQKYTQRLAYSNDDGRTVVKYPETVIENISKVNRDPKVVFVEEIGRYIMALYLKEHDYRLFSSHDLLHWDDFCDLTLDGDAECPDLFPLTCNGEKKWVFTGASDRYTVGHFTETAFVPETEPKTLQYSPVSYAAQSYAGTGDRVIRIAWHRIQIPEPRFSQQMSFPVEMSLSEAGGQYYLSALPIREIENLYLEGKAERYTAPVELGKNAVDIRIRLLENTVTKIRLFGGETVIDPEKNMVIFGKHKMPLSATGDTAELRILSDRCTVELYADGGRFCMTVPYFSDYNLPRLEISHPAVEVEWHRLKSTLPTE